MKTKDRLAEIEAQLDHITKRIDNLRDGFVYPNKKTNSPKEPLIKDEKIRKAVRAWAEACRLTHATYKLDSNEFYDADTRGTFAIKLTLILLEFCLEDGADYTIAELCGEEE